MLVPIYKTNQIFKNRLKSKFIEHTREPMVSPQRAFKPMVVTEDVNFKMEEKNWRMIKETHYF